jgi:ubiquinone/menaquinone biosynthesis C-methylase UbiE
LTEGGDAIETEESVLISIVERMIGEKLWEVSASEKGSYLISRDKEKLTVQVGSRWPYQDKSLGGVLLKDLVVADRNIPYLAKELSRILKPEGVCLSTHFDAMQFMAAANVQKKGIPLATLLFAFEEMGLSSLYGYFADSTRYGVLSSLSKATIRHCSQLLFARQPFYFTRNHLEQEVNILPQAGIKVDSVGNVHLGEYGAFHILNRNKNCVGLKLELSVEEHGTENPGKMVLNHFVCFYSERMKKGRVVIDDIFIPPGGSLLQWHGPELCIKDFFCEAFGIEEKEFCEWLPFDQYQRYWTITEAVKKTATATPRKMLDIGGYPGLTQPFLPGDQIWVIDIQACDRPNYIQMTGGTLPFEDGFFDAVISADTLEHMEKESRFNAIKEMVRVSKNAVVIAFPFSEGPAPLVDKMLDEYHKIEFGFSFPFLREHLELGFPSRKETMFWLEACGLHVLSIPNAYAPTYLPMMKQELFFLNYPKWHRTFRDWNRYYNRYLTKCDNREPAYRCIIVATKEKIDCKDLLADSRNIHVAIPILG